MFHAPPSVRGGRPAVDRLVAEARLATRHVHPQCAEAALDDAGGRNRQFAGVIVQRGSARADGHVHHPVARTASGVGMQVADEDHLNAVLLDQRDDVAAETWTDAASRRLPGRVMPGGEAEAGIERALGHGEDERSYVAAAQMLHALGVSRVALLSNNPDKARQLRSCGATVVEQVPTGVYVSAANHRYLETEGAPGPAHARASERLRDDDDRSRFPGLSEVRVSGRTR